MVVLVKALYGSNTPSRNGNGYCGAANRTSGSGIQSGIATNGLAPWRNTMTIADLKSGHINHGLYGYTFCNGTADGVYPGRTVFPAFAGLGACRPGTPIPVGGTCNVIAKFNATILGQVSDSITIVSNASNRPNIVNLSGTGTNPGGHVVVPPSGLDFGAQMVGTTSGSQPVSFQNTGTGPQTITSMVTTGDFAIVGNTNTCPLTPLTLAANATCTLSITFTPTVIGTRNGVLSFNTNDPLSPQTVALTGIGQQSAIPPIGVMFQQGVIGAH